MKLRLIKPKVKKNVYMLDFYIDNLLKDRMTYVVPPLSLAIIAALTPKDVEVSIVDENIEEIDFDEPADLVGITITSITAPRGFEIADIFRDKKLPVVIGGIHVSLMPKEALKHADSIIVGEAEDLWSQVIEDFKNKRLKKAYKSKHKPDLKDSPLPRWELVKNDRYAVATVQLTRGCPHDCEFCVVGKHLGFKVRKRLIQSVVEEIKLLKEYYATFWFVDFNLFFDRAYAKQFLKELIPLKIRYICFANTYIAKDDELLNLLAESGCEHVSIGFETINTDNLKLINKYKINNIKEYPEVIRKIQSYGIKVQTQFVIGFDHDDASVFRRIEDFVNENSIICPDIYLAGVFYGTKHYHRLKKEKRISIKDYFTPECQQYGYVQWDIKSMDYYDFLFGFISLYQRLYSYDAVFERIKKFHNAYNLKTEKRQNTPNFKKRFYNALLVLKCLSKMKKRYLGTSLLNLIRPEDYKRFEFILKLFLHPKSIYKNDIREIPGLLSKIEWRNVFMYPFFFDEYLNYKMKKEYSHNFLSNNFNKKVELNLKEDLHHFIRGRYQYYKRFKIRYRKNEVTDK